jgi:hypothetical protein
LSRAVALALALSTAATTTGTTGCATYEGSRDTAALGGITFAAGMGTWFAGSQAHDATTAFAGLALGTASMVAVMGSAVGMTILPKRVEIALRIAHELVVRAQAGDCEIVDKRRHEVEDLDNLVYEVVLMDDPAVSECFGLSSSSSSSPADRDHPDPASTSIVR